MPSESRVQRHITSGETSGGSLLYDMNAAAESKIHATDKDPAKRPEVGGPHFDDDGDVVHSEPSRAPQLGNSVLITEQSRCSFVAEVCCFLISVLRLHCCDAALVITAVSSAIHHAPYWHPGPPLSA